MASAPPLTTSTPRSIGAIRAGTAIGRYVVIERLGVGGMGVVLSAYDPRLDRKVAVKLLRAGRRGSTEADTAQQRLLREAQAMAKLDHPNVVSVHDTGTHDGSVFVAMEFVRGATLRAWWDAAPKGARAWQETVGVMRQAAQGLIAAHAAGLVHRDFKPDNVMIGDDGRVRVMDFGLVRAQRSVSEAVPELTDRAVLEPGVRTEEDAANDAMGRIRAKLAGLGKLGGADPSGDADTISDADPAAAEFKPERAFEDSLTRTGALLGTPAYMAPEQIEGVAVDARADQFAFCVTLYEALYGQRPFSGETWTALATAILKARVAEPPSDRRVPAWLSAVVMRGLARQPHDRFADMDALLAALRPTTASTRRWVAAGVGGVALAAAGLIAANKPDVCDAAQAEVDAAWNVERGAAVRSAFADADLPYSDDTAQRVVAAMERYASEWRTQWEAACRATHDDGAQTREMYDRRMACLDGRRRALGALAAQLEAGGAAVEHAVAATARLPDVAGCADLEALVAAVDPPAAAHASTVADIRARLADAAAMEAIGQYGAGAELAAELLAEANATDYLPLVAEAALQHGRLLDGARRPEEAAAALRTAASAGRSSGADDVAAAAEVRLVFVVGARLRDGAQARWWDEHARAAVHRVEPQPGRLDARRLNHAGVAAHLRGDVEEGARLLERAVAAHDEHVGRDHPDTLEALHNYGVVLRRAGNLDEALSVHQDVLSRRRRSLGALHPAVAESLGAVAGVKRFAGDAEGSVAAIEQALEILGRAPLDVRAGRLLLDLASARAELGELAQARTAHDEGRTILVDALGDAHPSVAQADANFARLLMVEGDFAGAAQRLAALATTQRRRLGAEHPAVGSTLGDLGIAQLELERTDEGVASLTEAERLLAKGGEPVELGRIRFALAKALAPSDPARARGHAGAALEAVHGTQGAGVELAAEVEAWLASEPTRP